MSSCLKICFLKCSFIVPSYRFFPCFADYESTALAGIEAMEDFFRSIHMPTNLRELGLDLTDEQIHELAFKCSFEDTRTIGVFKQLNMKDMEKIYMMAR